MTLRVSWATALALAAIVVVAGLVIAHTIGFYVQLLLFGLFFVAVLAFLARHSFRRATASWRARRQPPHGPGAA